MAYEFVLYERKGKIAYITLNRPQLLNAVNDTMHQELVDALNEFDTDKEAWIAILSGKGRCFSSGADVKQRQLRPREELERLGGPSGVKPAGGSIGLGQTVNWKPVIAAVHGYVLGISFAFMMGCDLVVAAEDTYLQIREVQRGLGGAGHWASAWFWGGGKFANDIALTGRQFSAEEARALGIVNRVVPAEQLMAEAESMANEVLANPPLAVRGNVRVARLYMSKMTEDASRYAGGSKLHLTEDFQESALAFMEKRPAIFKGK